VVVGLAAAMTPVVLPRAGILWTAPAVAPLLGAAGLAAAFPALAGLAPTPWRRAGLAAAGLVWLAAAELLGAGRLFQGAPEGAAAATGWDASVMTAAREAIWPLLASGTLLWAIAWAALALVVPLVVRAPGGVLRALAAAVWAAASIAATVGMGQLLPLADPRGPIAGAIVGAVAAFAWGTFRDTPEGFDEAPLP
jgi:hypothetical protein